MTAIRIPVGSSSHRSSSDIGPHLRLVSDAIPVDVPAAEAAVRALLTALVERLPVGSTIVLEAERDGHQAVLPEISRWDIRKYSRTQLAFLDLDAVGGSDEEP